MIHKRRSAHEGKLVITFEIPGSVWADTIHLVGDFNGWDRRSLPFGHNRRDNWQVEVELEGGREYRFRYLVDGVDWRTDRHADRQTSGEDGFYDSVVVTETTPVARSLLLQAE
ncbi:MAG: isoamylase early set domain-containing protein [Anaerolineae bacterium]|jgi:1,4-alpha-glucan branching enzyme